MNLFSLRIVLLGFAGCVLFSGCSTIVNSHRQKEPMMADYLEGENERAMEIITDKLSSAAGTGDEVMWRLESGALHFLTGKYTQSIDQFRSAEALIAAYDERATVSLRDAAAEGAMTVTNLNVLPYRGFCRDRIALAVFKSLGYLGEGREDAFRAQLRRLRDEQKKVMDDYKKFFEQEEKEIRAAKEQNQEAAKEAEKNSAALNDKSQNQEFVESVAEVKKVAHKGYGNFLNPVAIFLSGFGSLRDGNYENARIDFQRLYEAMPKSALIQRYYVTVLTAARRPIPAELKKVKPFAFPLDQDCLYVLFANGRSAAFRQIAVYFPVMTAWPMCEYYPAPYKELTVEADGKCYSTEMLADMDAILSQEFDERLPGMITRIVLSTAIKEAAKYAATYAVAQENALAGAGVYIGSSIYTALMNTADTRSWEILPKEFQLTQLPMPNDRKITIVFDGNQPGKTLTLPPDCRSAILYVNAPSAKVATYQILPLKSK